MNVGSLLRLLILLCCIIWNPRRHSVGGWLAQITNLTSEYLRAEGNIFLKSKSDQDCYHPNTVVFDSQGCKGMLPQFNDERDTRPRRRSYVNWERLREVYFKCCHTFWFVEHIDTVCKFFLKLLYIRSLLDYIYTVTGFFSLLFGAVWLYRRISTVSIFFSFLPDALWVIGHLCLIVGKVFLFIVSVFYYFAFRRVQEDLWMGRAFE
jgi:hypothetical protein